MYNNLNPDELMHYGVLGMKWGVKKNPTKAFHKAERKQLSFTEKATKYDAKAAKYKLKSTKARAGGIFRSSNHEKAAKYDTKSARYELKAAKSRKKGVKWANSMSSTFKNYKTKEVPGETVKVGMLWTARHVKRYNLTPLDKD